MKHLPALDGLRAVAVLAVVAYHAGLPVPAGFVGVDVFFVISGYLITRLLADEVRATGRIDFLHFYARRARRILPAAVLVVVVTLALSLLLPAGRAEVAESAAAASVFGANFYFQAVTGGYWDASAETMPLLHLWSLSVEEQFYLLWPLLLLLAAKRFQSGIQFGMHMRNVGAGDWLKAIFGWLKLRAQVEFPDRVNVGVHAHALAHVDQDVRKLHFGTHGLTIPLVAVAVASFVLAEALPEQAAFYQMPARAWELAAGGIVAVGNYKFDVNRGRIYSWIGLAIVLLACFVPLPHFPGIGALPAVAGATLLIAGIHAGQSVRVLESAPLASWKVRGWELGIGPISYSLYLWHWPLLALDKAMRVGDAPLTVRLALCALAFVLAALSYRYVEQPFRRSRAAPRRVVGIGLACVAALSCTAFAMSGTAEPKKPVAITSASLSCHAPLKPARCVGKEPKAVLWGDSYAGAWEAYVLRQGITAVGMIDTGCPPVLGVDLPRPTEKASRYCKERAAKDLAWLQANGADTLIVTAHWTRLLRERPDAGPGVIAWAKALPNVRRILVVGATPELRDSVERCQALGQLCDIPRAQFDEAAAATDAVMAELDKLPNVEVLPLGEWLCDANTCPGVRDGLPLYQHDSHHVSAAAVAAFAARL